MPYNLNLVMPFEILCEIGPLKETTLLQCSKSEGWLRTMIRVASTGEILVLLQFKCEMEIEREALLSDISAAFPKIIPFNTS